MLPAMYNRFDLEQALTATWAAADDLELLIENIVEDDLNTPEWDADRIANTLTGIQEMIKLRAEKAFKILEDLIRSKQLQ